MSNKKNLPLLSPKSENKNNSLQKTEKENRLLLDIQLLSTLKSIPGKIIPLSNKINDISKNNNQDNFCNKRNKIETINNINNIVNQIDKSNLNYMNNNNNSINNFYTSNNYCINNSINNNINPNYIISGGIGPFPDYYGLFDNPLLISPSNHPSFLSIKSDIKNNNFISKDNNFTQNSFYFHNFMMLNNNINNHNEYNFNKENNINNIINNKFSQLSYYNSGNEDFLKKKRSSHLLYRQNSHNSCEYNNNLNNNNSLLSYYNCYDNSKKENKNIIHINEEKEEKEINRNNNVKKVLFNIENYTEISEEENDTIYHNIINNNLDNNNLFNCYQKRRKKKKKNNEFKKYKCVHPKCDNSFKTLKQLQNHHYKMISECQYDSVQVLKLIYNVKIILIHLIMNNQNKKAYFTKLYEDSINKISLNNYSEFITGTHFNDKV